MRVFSLDQELTLIPAAIIREIHAVLVESPKSPWNANPACISRGTLFSPQVLSRQATNKLSRQAVQVEPTCHHDQHIRNGLTGPDPQARLIGIKVRKIQT